MKIEITQSREGYSMAQIEFNKHEFEDLLGKVLRHPLEIKPPPERSEFGKFYFSSMLEDYSIKQSP